MTRKKKAEEKPIDEEANQRALDEAAGVAEVRRSLLAPPPVARPANAAPLVKTDTREKRLYEIARACTTNLNDAFFDEFPDRQEILELALDISSRLLTVAILNGDMPPTQRIASMRLAAALAGKQLPASEEGERFQSAPPLVIPKGSKEEVAKTLDKIRQVQ